MLRLVLQRALDVDVETSVAGRNCHLGSKASQEYCMIQESEALMLYRHFHLEHDAYKV
jgi:hypothetical protein